MSSLTVYHQSSPEYPNKLLTHAEDIASTLAAVGVQFNQVPVQQPVIAGTASDELMAANRVQIDQLMTAHGYASAEILSLCDERGEGTELARALRAEQSCEPAHLHYYLAGRGLLALHVGEYVYSLLCEKGDLLLMPAGTAHWFDAGEHPRFAVLRLFDSAQVPAFTPIGGDFAALFAGLDDC
ncbi:acireductone dioxygenase [Pseudomonas sp.]|uniref:acireductone dioxygenase n=1 Tax=Pseudomonas sp. TaxID=306 RepID=UPI003C72B4C1